MSKTVVAACILMVIRFKSPKDATSIPISLSKSSVHGDSAVESEQNTSTSYSDHEKSSPLAHVILLRPN